MKTGNLKAQCITVCCAAMMMCGGAKADTYGNTYDNTYIALATKKGSIQYAVTGNIVEYTRLARQEVRLNAENKIVFLTSEAQQKDIIWHTWKSTSSGLIYLKNEGNEKRLYTVKTSNSSDPKLTFEKETNFTYNTTYNTFTATFDNTIYGICCFGDNFSLQNKNFFSEYPPAKPYFLADHTWRTLGSSTFGTICFPKAVRPAERAGATFYKITAKIMNGDEFKGVVLTEVEGELEAGIPYIFKKEGDATYIVAAMHGDAVTVAGSQGGLVGTLSEEEGGFAVPAGMYILQGDKLWQTTLNDKGESQSRLLAGRAYIDPSAITATVSYENANGVKGFILGVDAPFDGITQPQTEQRRDIHTTYDLQGRPVRQLLRGQTYIINGRKVHIK